MDTGSDRLGPYQWRLFIFVCIFWAIDGSEMYVMSLVLPELPAEKWGLSAGMTGALGGSTFEGMLAGTLFFGWISDKFGRLTTVRITLAIAAIFGALSPLSDSTAALFLLRFGFGFGVGGCVPSLIVLLIESSPTNTAVSSVGLTQSMFAVGGIWVTSVAVFVLVHLNWQWLLVFAALPLLFCAPFYIPDFIHESPGWLRATGNTKEAERVLGLIRVTNGQPDSVTADPKAQPLTAELVAEPAVGISSSKATALDQYRGLFGPHAYLTFTLMPLWAIMSFGYYGLIFIIPTFLNAHVAAEEETQGTLLTAAAEIPGYFIGGWLADKYGRRLIMGPMFVLATVFAFVTGVFASLMDSNQLEWGWFLLAACLFKTFISAGFLILMVYTAEAYPTLLTSTGYGLGNACTRLAGALTPYVGQVLLEGSSPFGAFAVYGAGCAGAAALAWALPFETKGRDADAVERQRLEGKPSEATPLRAA